MAKKRTLHDYLMTPKPRTRRYHHQRIAHKKNIFSRSNLVEKVQPHQKRKLHTTRSSKRICGSDMVYDPTTRKCVKIQFGNAINYSLFRKIQVLGPVRIAKLVGKKDGLWPNKTMYLVGDRHVLEAKCENQSLPTVQFSRLLHDSLVQASKQNKQVDVLSESIHHSHHWTKLNYETRLSYVIPSDNPTDSAVFLKDCDPGDLEDSMDLLNKDFGYFSRYGGKVVHHSVDPRCHFESIYGERLRQLLVRWFDTKRLRSDSLYWNFKNKVFWPQWNRFVSEIGTLHFINSEFQDVPHDFVTNLNSAIWAYWREMYLQYVIDVMMEQRQHSTTLSPSLLKDMTVALFAPMMDFALLGRFFRTFSYRSPIQNAVALVGNLHAQCIKEALVATNEFDLLYDCYNDNQCVLVDTSSMQLPFKF